jgi:malate dehydrogenase (oxaloacetate-decarboxylating)
MRRLAPIFTSINLEDIKAPDCFKIEDTLKATCRPAVFHDDQHGTAIVVAAAILSYCRLTKRDIATLKVVINGGGAAGNSICKLIKSAGIQHIIMCDTKGAIFKGRTYNMNEQKEQIADWTNAERCEGSLAEVVKGRDVFIGVSAAGALTKEMVATMNEKSFVLALANPEPEIYPRDALAAGAFVASTGRSDFPNQVNNSLAFPGLFRGVKRFRVSQISEGIKIAAAQALSHLIPDSELTPEYVIPQALNPEIPKIIAKIVGEVGAQEGLLRPEPKNQFEVRDPEELWY